MTLRTLEERVFTPTGGDDTARASSGFRRYASSPSDTSQASRPPRLRWCSGRRSITWSTTCASRLDRLSNARSYYSRYLKRPVAAGNAIGPSCQGGRRGFKSLLPLEESKKRSVLQSFATSRPTTFPPRIHTGALRRPSGNRNGAYSFCGAGKRGRL